MCGICGLWYFARDRAVEPELLARMTRSLAHRGPDEESVHREGSVGLGFRRLSIIDVAGSHQPIANEDGTIHLVCNGEVYNFQELRAQLVGRHSFRTHGDLEPILHGYEDHGVAWVRSLRGMYAFALWDRNRDTVTLGVDRFGKKPLYYLLDGQRLAFGSELKCIAALPDLPRQLDPAAFDEYLSTGYIRAPRTIYQAIRKLPPGHTLTVTRDGQARLEPYWEPRLAPPAEYRRESLPELAEGLREQLREAVRLRMISDVPLGAFLSGGIDSSIVVGLMSQLSSRPVRTFSIGLAEAEYDESPHARAVAGHCRTDHSHEVVRPDIVDLLPKLVCHYDEPFADNSMIPTYYVSAMARRDVTVALSGDGGDEVFAGYHWYRRAFRHARLQRWIPPVLRPLAASLAPWVPRAAKLGDYLAVLNRPPTVWAHANDYFDTARRRELYRDEAKAWLAGCDADRERQAILDSIAGHNWLSQAQYADLVGFLPGDILVKTDRASMFTSLEVRCPLLDHKVFEYMAAVPPHLKMDAQQSKLLLKRAAGDLLPPAILQRRKRGFDLPMNLWLRGPLRPMLEDLLLAPGARTAGLLRSDTVKGLADAHASGRERHEGRLWTLLCLELWLRESPADAPGL